jgi:alpha-tubulin suppressor-like RCC1 family protein
VTSFSISETHCIALDKSGMIWVWGENTEGELGLGDCLNRKEPFPLCNLKNKQITQVIAANSISIAVS